jgi:hypothetical protein
MAVNRLIPSLGALTSAIRGSDSKSPEIILGSERYPITRADEAVAAVFGRGMKNVVLFVHGRALASPIGGPDWEPRKSRMQIIPKLEERYGSAVIMLHWPHFGTSASVPAGHARAAAGELQILVNAIGQYRSAHPDVQVPVTLLTHSMGSIVLEELVRRGGASSLATFRSVLLAAPASKAEGSVEWLTEIAKALGPDGEAYVTLNKHDAVLLRDMLGGQGISEMTGQMAPGVKYLTLEGLYTMRHRYLVSLPLIGEHFVGPILAGEPVDWFSQEGSGQQVYAVKRGT